MDGELSTGSTTSAAAGVVRRRLPRPIRAHVFASLVIAGVLIGGGLRFVPTSVAALAGSSGQGGASTACAAK